MAVDSSPELIASVTAHATNSRELSSESFLLARSSGCRWASNTEVTRNAAAARSFESACTAALMNASSRPTSVVAARARSAPAATTSALVCSTTSR